MAITSAKYERLRGQLKSTREQLEEGAEIGVNSIMSGVGAGLSGLLYARMPAIPGTSFPLSVAFGGTSVILGLSQLFGSLSVPVAEFGSGFLNHAVGRAVEEFATPEELRTQIANLKQAYYAQRR